MNSTTKSNPDRSLLELFLSEVESHTAVLTQGLLAMENDAKAVGTHIEAMMRAAHSSKAAPGLWSWTKPSGWRTASRIVS